MVLSRIERKQSEAADRARREETERQQRQFEQKQAEERIRQEQLRKAEERRQFVQRQTSYVLGTSGVLRGLEEIRDGKLAGSVRKYALVVNLDASAAELVWGNKFAVVNNVVGYEKQYSWSDGVKDYQSIRVEVNPDTMDLYVQRRLITKQQWQADPGLILDALADAYINPSRLTDRESDHRYDSSRSGYTTECCC